MSVLKYLLNELQITSKQQMETDADTKEWLKAAARSEMIALNIVVAA